MGMAASQARLLCITARIHDVEHQAQSIQHAKLQLGIQSDRVYDEYVEALDAATLTVKTFDPKSAQSATVAATFNNLCSRNKAFFAGNTNYAIHVNGWLLVEDEIEEGYKDFMDQYPEGDALDFAMYMLYGNSPEDNDHNVNNNDTYPSGSSPVVLQPDEEEIVKPTPSDPEPPSVPEVPQYNPPMKPNGGSSSRAASNISSEEENYSIISNEDLVIYSDVHPPRHRDEDEEMYKYYMSIFNQIQASGGCVSIADYGDKAANDSEWLKKMVESGVFVISTVEEIDEDDDGKKDYAKFSATSPSSDTNLAYTTTSEIDSTALKKAEAKYENDMRKINQKDKQFDLDLSKLETERTALTTQYDSIKKVIEDNIDRTFGIFS